MSALSTTHLACDADAKIAAQKPCRARTCSDRGDCVQVVKWPLQLRLFRRRLIWCPTWTGLSFALLLFVALVVAWVNYGESYLAFTQRSPADILVVEGWIGRKGVGAAVDEFKRGDYHYVVCTGGSTSDRWEDQSASFAELAAAEMIRLGVPKTTMLVATTKITESHRTFESAVAVWRTLREGGIDATVPFREAETFEQFRRGVRPISAKG